MKKKSMNNEVTRCVYVRKKEKSNILLYIHFIFKVVYCLEIFDLSWHFVHTLLL